LMSSTKRIFFFIVTGWRKKLCKHKVFIVPVIGSYYLFVVTKVKTTNVPHKVVV